MYERDGISKKTSYERGIYSFLSDKSKQTPAREGRADMSTAHRNVSKGIKNSILPRAEIVFKRSATKVTTRGR